MYLSVYLLSLLSIFWLIYLYRSICLLIYLSIYLSICLFIYLLIYLVLSRHARRLPWSQTYGCASDEGGQQTLGKTIQGAHCSEGACAPEKRRCSRAEGCSREASRWESQAAHEASQGLRLQQFQLQLQLRSWRPEVKFQMCVAVPNDKFRPLAWIPFSGSAANKEPAAKRRKGQGKFQHD